MWNYDNALPFIDTYYPKWQNFFRNIPLVVIQADIIRYMILEQYGGWYFDLDCEALRAIDVFSHHQILLPLESSIAFGDTQDQIGNAILASKPQHPLWNIVLSEIWQHKDEILALTQKKQEEVIFFTGPSVVQTAFDNLDKVAKDSCIILKREHFHMPFEHPLTHAQYKNLQKNPEVFTLHHSYSTWRNTNTKSLFRRKAIARNPLLHKLSKLWARIKSTRRTR